MNEFDDPADAARKLVKTSAALWAEKNDYCDDITAIVIFINEDSRRQSTISSRSIKSGRSRFLRRSEQSGRSRQSKSQQEDEATPSNNEDPQKKKWFKFGKK